MNTSGHTTSVSPAIRYDPKGSTDSGNLTQEIPRLYRQRASVYLKQNQPTSVSGLAPAAVSTNGELPCGSDTLFVDDDTADEDHQHDDQKH